MTCMALIAQPIAMATTQLARAVRHQDNFSWHVEPKANKPLRMNWVVVTDEPGQRRLRMQWVASKTAEKAGL